MSTIRTNTVKINDGEIVVRSSNAYAYSDAITWRILLYQALDVPQEGDGSFSVPPLLLGRLRRLVAILVNSTEALGDVGFSFPPAQDAQSVKQFYVDVETMVSAEAFEAWIDAIERVDEALPDPTLGKSAKPAKSNRQS